MSLLFLEDKPLSQLDPASPIPLHFQLRTLVRDQIQQQSLPPHTALPTEVELARIYHVSRTTVRQAILSLVNDGWLYRQRGNGTFVAPRRVEENLNRLRSLREELEEQGIVASAHTLAAALVNPPADVARDLEVEPGSLVFRCERLRLADGEPIALELGYWAGPVAPRLAAEDMDDAFLYQLVENAYGIKLRDAELSIEAVQPDERQAALLGIRPRSAVLLVRRLTRTAGGQPIELCDTLYRADRYKYRITVAR